MRNVYNCIHKPVFFISIFCIIALSFLLHAYFDNVVLRMTLSFTIVACLILCIYMWERLSHKTFLTHHFLWKGLFLFFLFQLCYLLFFDPEFSRDRVILFQNNYISGIREQWVNHTNLTPFKTIQSMWFVRDYDGYVGQFAKLNLIGNVIAFMPAAFFLPFLIQRYRRLLPFALTLACVIISVELLQLFTLTGTMDIDDFILNYAGVMLLYLLLYCTPLRKHVFHLYAKL